MSADIEKLAVFDARIVQSRPKYAVEKGALSLTNAPFNAIAATPSQHTYNIYVPSENVFVDRGMEWTSTVSMTFQASVGSAVGSSARQSGQPMVVPGRDFSLSSFPLNSLCSTLTATINDTTTVINSQDVMREVMRLADHKKNRLQRTCPTMLDKYLSYNACAGAVNNPIGGIETATDYDNVGNGAWFNLLFTDPQSTPLTDKYVTGAIPVSFPAYPAASGWSVAPYSSSFGMPVMAAAWDVTTDYGAAVGAANLGAIVLSGGTIWQSSVGAVVGTAPGAGVPGWTSLGLATASMPYYIRWGSTEKLILSPFTFSDVHEWDTGLFGINNIQLIMNLQAPGLTTGARVIRTCSAYGATFSGLAYNSQAASGVFVGSRINVQFLTPSLDVPLPPKSVVPYMEFPRYITQYSGGQMLPGATQQIQSQTITLPQIPDLFVIYVKPSQYSAGDADWYLPVATSADGVSNPLTVNFDNFSGLLSSQTAEQLYSMSVHNGLDMDYNTWSGAAHSGAANSVGSLGGNVGGSGGLAAGRVPMVGGLLVLKPSQDITLQTGQAPSLVGNFTFQFNLTVKNTSTVIQNNPQLFVITVNSGFFESIRGSSRIIKGVLSEQDIISAPLAPMATRDELHRMTGAGLFSGLKNLASSAMKHLPSVVSKGMEFYKEHKEPIHKAMALGKEAYDKMRGGRVGGRAGGLSARLM